MNWTDKFFEKFKPVSEHDPNYTNYDVASFVDDNWGEMTGLENYEKDEEGEFPEEVLQFIDSLDVDYNEFCEEWGMVREGAEWDLDEE